MDWETKSISSRSRDDVPTPLTRIFHEMLLRDLEDGRATGLPEGVGPEPYLNGTSQGPTPEDARKNDYGL